MVKFLFDMGASVVLKFSLFDRNVPNKHKNSECNSVIGLFNLKTNNSGRYNRFGYLSLKCAGSALVGIFNKVYLRINSW